ncbi:TPA: M23 family peptidase [Candidatus Berkelbacteria bacterium]|uniref:M23ase beta-sheet core domain-containing protein n=1 Tax=Berkelbacteria bacterium GW2011_GWE1_39_12 TaxID=1618337 RepID=A0A0G4B4W0_9BACT|nr:MAG: hypothetical protein UT28_C0001G0863 [Berkelbacteria bacterium GW2011_GWE1_39_12]HBO60273.1 M23 family peptidase [Candidatus Berkelbacteria bacterium]
MWKWFKWVLLSIGIMFAIGALLLFQPWAFLPHKHIEISLPFPKEADSYTDLIPMGEIEQWHNASTGLPNGHPGIDFGWEKETDILAVADGRIINIRKNHEGQYIVEQSLGLYYRTVYQELNKLEPDIRFLAKIKKGQVIGQTGRPHVEGMELQNSAPSRQMHWDFSSSSYFINRICPVGYFDTDSRKRIEAIWARVKANGNFKPQYPDICNGYYENMED